MDCPICGEEINSTPIKTWKYANIAVKRYKCESCDKKFNLYIGKNKQYTIPKAKK